MREDHAPKGWKHAMKTRHATRSTAPSPRSPVLGALGALWLGFKFVLSLGLVAFAAMILWTSKNLIQQPGPLGVGAFMLFLAALPWVPGRISRALGLLNIFMSISFAFIAGSMVTGGTQLPGACTGRSAAFCEFINDLHALGGPWLAALPVIVAAATMLGGGIVIIVRAGQPMHPRPL
jgi:hypothetical protein